MARATLKKITSKAKTAKIKLPRKSKTTMFVDEKHVGSLTEDWSSFTSHEDAKWVIYESLQHLAYFYDIKDTKPWVAAYIKAKLPQVAAKASRVDVVAVGHSIAAQARLIMMGAPFTATQVERVNSRILEAINRSSDKIEELAEPTIVQKMSNKTSDIISEIEEALDVFMKAGFEGEFSTYNLLQKVTAAPASAQAVSAQYKPLHEELVAVKKDADAKYGYRHLSAKQLKAYQDFVAKIVSDAEMYVASKKATKTTRKPRVVKMKTNDQLASKMKFAPSSAEFKVTSVQPKEIIGSEKVVLFDTKYRTLTVLSTNNAAGFTISGTTVLNVDKAVKKKIRKPEDTLPLILKATKAKLDGVYNMIKCKEAEATGRINENIIILKVHR